jgi:hypothetical protein
MRLNKPKIKPELKIADNFLDLRAQETNVIVRQLEEQMQLRELPLEKHVLRSRKQLSRDE